MISLLQHLPRAASFASCFLLRIGPSLPLGLSYDFAHMSSLNCLLLIILPLLKICSLHVSTPILLGPSFRPSARHLRKSYIRRHLGSCTARPWCSPGDLRPPKLAHRALFGHLGSHMPCPTFIANPNVKRTWAPVRRLAFNSFSHRGGGCCSRKCRDFQHKTAYGRIRSKQTSSLRRSFCFSFLLLAPVAPCRHFAILRNPQLKRMCCKTS